MSKFKVLRGLHTVGRGKDMVTYGPGEKAGDVVESSVDLVERFGPQKFCRLDAMGPTDNFDGMSLSALQEYAAEHEIDISGAKLKREVVATIRRALTGWQEE